MTPPYQAGKRLLPFGVSRPFDGALADPTARLEGSPDAFTRLEPAEQGGFPSRGPLGVPLWAWLLLGLLVVSK